MTATDHAVVVVLGLPRSGTTWVASALGRASGGAVRHEPDNEKEHLAALRAKRGLGRFPVLGAEDTVPAYRELWARTLAGFVPDETGLRGMSAGSIWHRLPGAAREGAVGGRPGPATRLAVALDRTR